MIETFLNCDWGTSRFRLRLIETATQSIQVEQSSEDGVATFSASNTDHREQRFREHLQRQVDQLSRQVGTSLALTPIVISGMASSSMGWRDLPYATLPFPLSGVDLPLSRLDIDRTGPVVLCSGVRGSHNVMRGEEVELMGLNSLLPSLMDRPEDLWVVLPGTHSKHALVRNRSIVDFHTHMTGELFHLLKEQSSLRHANESEAGQQWTPPTGDTAWQEAFAEGVKLTSRAGLGESLFQVRVGQLLRGHDARQSKNLLSGLLIGDEIRSLLSRCDQRDVIILCASEEMSQPYRLTLELLEAEQEVVVLPSDDVVRLSACGQLQLLEQALCSTHGNGENLTWVGSLGARADV